MELGQKHRLDGGDRCQVILTALREEGPQTVDEFVTRRGLYHNSWAPSFTRLRQGGLVRRNGERRLTAHGSEAYVIAVTKSGEEWLS